MEPELRLTASERANLVAYVDGELDEDEARELALKLPRCVSARREIEYLEQSWDLLDLLPRPHPPDDFATRTVSMATHATANDDRFTRLARELGVRGFKLALCAGTAGAMLTLGYLTSRWLWPDRTYRLARDLTLAEHLDEYQAVETFEFLRLLDDHGSALWSEPLDVEPPASESESVNDPD